MKKVLDCLSTLRMDFMMRFSRIDSSNSWWKSTGERGGSSNSTPKEERFRMLSSPPFGEHRRKLIPDSKTPNGVRRTPKMTGVVCTYEHCPTFELGFQLVFILFLGQPRS